MKIQLSNYINIFSTSKANLSDVNSEEIYDLQLRVKLCALHYQTASLLKSSDGIKFYEGPEFSNLPGSTNVCFSLYDATTSVVQLRDAIRKEDQDSITDACIRILGAPVSFTQGLTNGLYLGLSPILGEASLFRLGTASYGLGIVLCLIEGIVELIGIKRQVAFNHAWFDPIRPLLSENEHPLLLLEKLKGSPHMTPLIKGKIEQAEHSIGDAFHEALVEVKALFLQDRLKSIWRSHFSLSEEELSDLAKSLPREISDKKIVQHIENQHQAKLSNLARRIRPHLTETFLLELPLLLQKFCSPKHREEGVERAVELMQSAQIQSYKKILVHTVGIAALTVTVIGLILGLMGCPILLPLLITSVGLAIGFVRYALAKGLLESEGLHFDALNLLPEWVKQKKQNPERDGSWKIEGNLKAISKGVDLKIPEMHARGAHSHPLPG